MRLAVGVPALFVAVFGLVIGLRLAGRSLEGSGLWLVGIPVLVVFAAYFAHAFWVLARVGREPPDAAGDGADG